MYFDCLCFLTWIWSTYSFWYWHIIFPFLHLYTHGMVKIGSGRIAYQPLKVKSRFFKNRKLYWSNLPQNSNCGRELVQKSGVQIPVGKGQIFLSCFLFIFIFSIKNWILTHKILFFIFFYQLNINKNRYIEQILFYFYVTC